MILSESNPLHLPAKMQLLDLPHELLELWDIFEAQTTQETYA